MVRDAGSDMRIHPMIRRRSGFIPLLDERRDSGINPLLQNAPMLD